MKTTDNNDNVQSDVVRILDGYLEMNSRRKTPERYAILKAVYSMQGSFSVDELDQRLNDEYKFPVSRSTLYNALQLFVELRLVIKHRFRGTNLYTACYDDKSHCHQICTMCGKESEVDAREISEVIGNMHLKRFKQDGYSLSIYGICSTCQAQMTRQKNKSERGKR